MQNDGHRHCEPSSELHINVIRKILCVLYWFAHEKHLENMISKNLLASNTRATKNRFVTSVEIKTKHKGVYVLFLILREGNNHNYFCIAPPEDCHTQFSSMEEIFFMFQATDVLVNKRYKPASFKVDIFNGHARPHLKKFMFIPQSMPKRLLKPFLVSYNWDFSNQNILQLYFTIIRHNSFIQVKCHGKLEKVKGKGWSDCKPYTAKVQCHLSFVKRAS